VKLLLRGLDTVECCYYLDTREGSQFPFETLLASKESIQRSKTREPQVVQLGNREFLLQGNGSGSGYPIVLKCPEMIISCGEYNNPAFYVKFISFALWHTGPFALHTEFLEWAQSLGLKPAKSETLSRVDWAFDFLLPEVDFDDNNLLSKSAKSAVHKDGRTLQTVQFGKGDVVLRLYDKVAEIQQKSGKSWFFELWGAKENVWRVEWQIRKDLLRRFCIRTFDDLETHQGDLLRYLSTEHDSLRVRTDDSNRSRWPLHPLWVQLQHEIEQFTTTGLYRDMDDRGQLQERLTRISISVYGYLKQAAAIRRLLSGQDRISLDQSVREVQLIMREIHDPGLWATEVETRINRLRLGGV